LSQTLPLSAAGHLRYDAWRQAPATTAEEAALVLEVLVAICTGGWPPRNTEHGLPAPRWPVFRDTSNPCHWIVAAADNLWVVVRPNAESFDFVTAMTPEKEQLVAWPFEPPEPETNSPT
jgi:hypothetical protein